MAGRDGSRGAIALLCTAVVLVAGSLGSCAQARPGTSDCAGADRTEVPDGRDAPGAPTADPPAPAAEALWVADASGVLQAVDGRTDQVTARVDIGGSTGPPRLVAGGGLVWAYQDDGGVTVVDPVRARVTGSATVTPAKPLADNRLLHAHGALWIAQPGRLWRVSPTGAVTSRQISADFTPALIAATGRWLWLAGDRRLVRVDPATVTASVVTEPRIGTGVGQLLGTPDALLAVGGNRSEIWVLDPDSAAVRSSIQISDGELVGPMFDVGDDVWAIGNCGNALRMRGVGDPQVQKVRISDVSQDFPAVVAAGSLWVADVVRSELVRIDLRTAEVLSRLPVEAADPDDPAFTVVAGRRGVWLLDSDFANGILRVDPATNRVLRLTSPGAGQSGISAVVAAPPD